jgi:hypothetical protein
MVRVFALYCDTPTVRVTLPCSVFAVLPSSSSAQPRSATQTPRFYYSCFGSLRLRQSSFELFRIEPINQGEKFYAALFITYSVYLPKAFLRAMAARNSLSLRPNLKQFRTTFVYAPPKAKLVGCRF